MNVPLEKVFTEIENQTGYTFTYPGDISNAKHITLDLKDAGIDETMRACLKGQPFDFSIEGKTILVIDIAKKKSRHRRAHKVN